jgi:hypothetical protein
MRIAKSLLFIVLIFGCLSGCDTGGNMKGALADDELAYIENGLYPLLVKAGTCSSPDECHNNYRKYWTCFSHNALSCEIYGVTDKKMIMEILLSMINSKLRIRQVTFWRPLDDQNHFFETPLLEFTDHTWDK